eukprot:5617319-Amphidinium_carterae.1
MQAWRALGIRHAVAQSELLPVLFAMFTWRVHLKGADTIVFPDNKLNVLAVLDVELGGTTWITRAATGAIGE